MPRLLLVEDDSAIAQPLARALTREDFEVVHMDRGNDAIAAALGGGFDLVVLDLTLPDVDGLEVCRRIRAHDSTLPIIMLTARSDELDLVVGFDAGADDYMAKPFSMAELTARVRARLRLTRRAEGALETHGIRLEPDAHRAWHGDEELKLTPKEFELLTLLMSDAGRVVTRQRILAEVWNDDFYATSRSLDVHVSALRRKLGDPPDHPRYVTTVRGVGFRFETEDPSE
ncbi:MAG: response regulator transcription factor [Acidimicrobiales bacterium]